MLRRHALERGPCRDLGGFDRLRPFSEKRGWLVVTRAAARCTLLLRAAGLPSGVREVRFFDGDRIPAVRRPAGRVRLRA
jgi:hypothetical protein